MYAMLLWLHGTSDRLRVPFRHLHLQVLMAGARKMGLKPPRQINPETLSDE